MRQSILLFLILPLFAACGGAHQESKVADSGEAVEFNSGTDGDKLTKMESPSLEVAEEADANVKADDVQNPTANASQKLASQIIKNATIRFQVEDLAKSTLAVQQAVKSNNGYVNSSNETRSNREMSSTIVIRVPFSQFDKLLEELFKQSIFVNTKNITSEDVTEQFVDIQARVKAKKVAEQRYLDILRQAKTVKDVLEVENQLRQIREEVEVQQGRLQYLQDQVKYSTINLEIYQQTAYQPEPELGFFSQFFMSLREGGAIFLGFLVILVKGWPFLLVASISLYFIRRWERRKNAKKNPLNR